jgi:membrane-bound metal-dependent hydrolase YbcI (DUF457 family)
LALRRLESTLLATALVAVVLLLDLVWSLLEGSTGRLAYALVDERAHLATCTVALLSLMVLARNRLPARFVAAALVASVAIDIDHLPRYLGSHMMTGDLPRPYTHSLLLVAVLLGLGLALKRRDQSLVVLGLAFGVSAHLLRDLATGPGVPMLWPVSSEAMVIPYPLFAGSLALLVATIAVPRRALATGRAVAAVALLALALGAGLLGPARAAAGPTVSIGAFIPGADQNPSLIDNFDAETGRSASFLVCYKDWSQAPFVGDQLDGIWNHGAVPLVTWEPYGVSLRAIARGDYDGYVWDAARTAAAWDKPLMIRFAQEMNGDWFPWGGHPAAYKAAWRHLVRIFREAGADKVRWVWNPYVNSRGGKLPFVRYFPGGKWVDWAGLDAINWGGSFPWRTFRQIIGASYQQMIRLTSKPVIVAEAGSGEQGGNKAHWLGTMLRRNIPNMGHVRAVSFWSEADPRGDLRINSSSAALEAVRSALGKPLYETSRRALIRTPARLGG